MCYFFFELVIFANDDSYGVYDVVVTFDHINLPITLK